MVNEGYNIYIGKQIKSYTIQKKLGSGGSACVYLSQNHLHEYAAIKILHQNYTKFEGQRLFRQEIQILQELRHHQNILPILDYGKHEDTPYIITEYMPGETLRKRINTSHPAEIEKLLALLTQISQAIYAVHRHDIVHNDLKPENILFNKREEVVLADFGIALQLGRHKKIVGHPHGTYAYMAPEQFDGIYSKAGDQYSLGCIAYELLTGRHPFESLPGFNPRDLEAMQEQHRKSKPPPLREFNSTIPVDIEQAILTSMAKSPSKRHTSIVAFIRSLQPPLLAPPQVLYHFTYPLDTPPPYTPSFIELPIPAISPDSTAVTLPPDQEVGEIVHMQAFSRHILHYPAYHHPPDQIFPQNIDDGQLRHTDPNILRNGSGKLESITDRGIKKARPPNPLKTRDLQLPRELELLLSPLLMKNLGLKLHSKTKPHPITRQDWTYTAIVANKPEAIIAQEDFVPQYSIIYLPGTFLTTSKYINDISMIFALFSQEILIIFSETKVDFDIGIDNLIEEGVNLRRMKIDFIKQKHINDLRFSQNTDSQLNWIHKYLKTEFLPIRPREVEPAEIGILEAIVEKFLDIIPTPIQNFLEDSGSNNLKKIFLRNKITQNGTHDIIAHNIIKRLNEPPYQPDNTGHTLLGEFLCLLLQKHNFASSNSQTAQNIKQIIRKYRLGPSACPHCSS